METSNSPFVSVIHPKLLKKKVVRISGKHMCKKWNILAFHYRHININHPENET
jgi:hypothetical protein